MAVSVFGHADVQPDGLGFDSDGEVEERAASLLSLCQRDERSKLVEVIAQAQRDLGWRNLIG